MTARAETLARLDRYSLYVGLAECAEPSLNCFAYYREMAGVIAQAADIPSALVELESILLLVAEQVAAHGGTFPEPGDFEWEAELAAEGLPDFTRPDFGLRDSGAYGAFSAGLFDGPGPDEGGLGIERSDPPDLDATYRDGPPDDEPGDRPLH